MISNQTNDGDHAVSRFIDSYKIDYFLSTNWAFLQIFTAFNTGSVMFTWHIDTVFIRITANNTSIWMRFMTNQ